MIHSQNTNSMTKHVGVYGDKKCAIVLVLPEDQEKVHIIDTESLPEILHQNLMEMITSPEGQEAIWLGDVMQRRLLHDGTNALRSFYAYGLVQIVQVSMVKMSPRPGILVALSDVLPFMTGQATPEQQQITPMPSPAFTEDSDPRYQQLIKQEQTKLDAQSANIGNPEEVGYNQHLDNMTSDVLAENAQIANGLIAQAVQLEYEAKLKRTDAARYNPSLATETVGYVDPTTGKSYKTAGALKAAQTRRENKES